MIDTTDFVFPTSMTTSSNEITSLVAFNAAADNPVFSANSTHPRWNEIVEGLRLGDSDVWECFDMVTAVFSKFNEVTERVSWNGSDVLFDGVVIHDALSRQLQRALEDGDSDNYVALAKFWEKLASNPNSHSRTQAYDWLSSHDFQITQDGDIVGYKYVNRSSETLFHSSADSKVPNKPSGYVNGEPIAPLSRIPQSVGDVVTMPRDEVAHDPSQACKAGLHVGTYNYVKSGNPVILRVHVNPRDIVSVPTDGGGEKVRVCRYKVDSVFGNDVVDTAPVLRVEPSKFSDVSTRI